MSFVKAFAEIKMDFESTLGKLKSMCSDYSLIAFFKATPGPGDKKIAQQILDEIAKSNMQTSEQLITFAINIVKDLGLGSPIKVTVRNCVFSASGITDADIANKVVGKIIPGAHYADEEVERIKDGMMIEILESIPKPQNSNLKLKTS